MVPIAGTDPAVVVVDVSRKRADPDLETAYPAVVESVGPITRLLDASREADVPTFFTRGGRSYFTSSGADLTEAERGGWIRKFPLREEDETTAEHAYTIAPALEPQEDEPVISKSAPSAFFKSMLPVYLSSAGVDTVVVAGMVTSGCLRATVVDAFSHGYHVVVPEECAADPDEDAHEFHLREIQRSYGHVEPLADVVEYVRAVTG